MFSEASIARPVLEAGVLMLILMYVIDTLEDMQRSLSNRESEYQDTLNRLSEEKGELQISLEKSKMQIEQLKEERKRTDELLGKAGLLDPSGAPGLDFGQV